MNNRNLFILFVVVCLLIIQALPVSATDQLGPEYNRSQVFDGYQLDTSLLIEEHPVQSIDAISDKNILVVTGGSGPLEGINPVDEKDYWIAILKSMGYASNTIDYRDGFGDSGWSGYDLVIYDAGGYFYPLSGEIEELWDIHYDGIPLIIVAPDINYDWENIQNSAHPTFCNDVLHISGVLGIMPGVTYPVQTDTGHKILTSVPIPEEGSIPIAEGSSFPDCFALNPENYGVLKQGYISLTEFGMGSCSGIPDLSPYSPTNLYAVTAYPGSDTEGSVVLYGFPPTVIGGDNNILAKLTEGSIQYALSESGSESGGSVSVSLGIENAPGDIAVVNKAPGDMVDVVAIVAKSGTLDQTATVEITPPDGYGSPEEVVIRDDYDPNSLIRTVNGAPDSVTLSDQDFTDSTIQVVWRYAVPDDAESGSNMFQVEADVGGSFAGYDIVLVNVVDTADFIVVTNRHALFENYHDGDDVPGLLLYLYQISERNNVKSGKTGVVYFVDQYEADLETWDQDYSYAGTDEQLNAVAITIDDYINDWATNLATENWYGSISEYPYLVILGGDEAIPFYRIKDPDKSEDAYNKNNPVLDSFDRGYYLSDNIYADVDGIDWEIGELEIATGRIVGAMPKDMIFLIQNGLNGPLARSNIIYAKDDDQAHDSYVFLKSRWNLVDEETLYNNPNPFSKDDILNAFEQNPEMFVFSCHGGYKSYCDSTGSPIFYGTDLSDVEGNGKNYISTNRPFIANFGCSQGVVPRYSTLYSDCLMNSWAFFGMSGSISAGGLVHTVPDETEAGDLFQNYFFENLFENLVGINSNAIAGKIFNDAKADYPPFVKYSFQGTYWSPLDKKTLTEFIYYGIPWMTIPYPSSGDSAVQSSLSTDAATPTPTEDLTVTLSPPASIGGDRYARTLTVNVTGYTIAEVEGFDVITINGTENMGDIGIPVLPTLVYEVNLPSGSELIDITEDDCSQVSLGELNIPAYGNGEGALIVYSDQFDVTGDYPEPRYFADIMNREDYDVLRIYSSLVTYNPQTNETVLFENSTLEVSYQTKGSVIIEKISTDKHEYYSGEDVIATATVANAGGVNLTGLKPSVSIIDIEDDVLLSAEGVVFALTGGESAVTSVTIPQDLSQDSYRVILDIIDISGTPVASAVESISVSTGSVPELTCEEQVTWGDPITFETSFVNERGTPVDGYCEIVVYGPSSIEIAELSSLNQTIAAGSGETFSVMWSSAGKETGVYEAVSRIFVDSEKYTSYPFSFEILEKNILQSSVPGIILAASDPTITGVNITPLGLGDLNTTFMPDEFMPQDAILVDAAGTGMFRLAFPGYLNPDAMMAYKINADNQWVLLDSETINGILEIIMYGGDPPVVIGSMALPSSSISSQGSGGSGGSTSTIASAAENVKAGVPVTFSINKAPVRSTEITFNNTFSSVLLTFDAGTDLPAGVDQKPDFDVYRYLTYVLYKASADDVESVRIDFAVPLSLLMDADVILLQYIDGEWTALPTEKTGEMDGDTLFSAESSSFSAFAIAFSDSATVSPTEVAEGDEGVQEEATVVVETGETAAPLPNPSPGFGLIITLFALAAVGLFVKRK